MPTPACSATARRPLSMLDLPPRVDLHAPDFTHNLLNFVNLTGTQFLTEHLLLSGNVYYRHLATGSNNGDVNEQLSVG